MHVKYAKYFLSWDLNPVECLQCLAPQSDYAGLLTFIAVIEIPHTQQIYIRDIGDQST